MATQQTLDISNYSLDQLKDLRNKILTNLGQLKLDYTVTEANIINSLAVIEQQIELKSKPQEQSINLPKLKKVAPPTINNNNDNISPLYDHNPELTVNKKDISNTLDYSA